MAGGTRPTDRLRRICGVVDGMRPNTFEEVSVPRAAVAEECARLDEGVEAARQDAWDEGFKAGRARAEADLSARLMPEGCEWPRYEDGEPVKLGDMALIDGEADMVEAVQLWIHGKPVIYGDGGSQQLEKGERVKRPAVLAADGEPLEVGQTVWHVGNGIEFTVIRIPNPGEYQAVKLRLDNGAFTGLDPDQLTHQRPVLDADGVPIREGDTVWDEHCDELVVLAVYGQDVHCRYAEYEDQICDNGTWEPSQLTHRAPALAADGRPLREGETVWDVETGDRYTVDRVFSGTTEPDFPGHTVACRRPDDVVTHMFEPSQLTHERTDSWGPDSWERLEEDATVSPEVYCVKRGIDFSDVDGQHRVLDEVTERMARDIVRRARVLAKRDR